jgi:tripartite ATP-independent transporter DctP family solute receptor
LEQLKVRRDRLMKSMKSTGWKLAKITLLLVGSIFLSAAVAQTLRLAHHHAVGSTVDQTADKFAELVAEKTSGQVKIQVYPAAQLGQELEAFDLLNNGLVDFTITSLGLMDKYWEPINVTSLPFVYRDWDHVEEAFAGEYGETVKEGVAGNSNVELLGFLHLGFRHMLFREEPVTDVDGMKGLRMRSPEQNVWIRMFELVGARPTPVTWGEVYTAMQTGVAAGLETPAQAALDMHFDEVTSAMVLTNHMFGTMAISANEKTMPRLSREFREAVQAAAEEAAEWSNRTISRPGEETALVEFEERGVAVLPAENPQEWADAMRPLWEEVTGDNEESQRLLEMLVEAE